MIRIYKGLIYLLFAVSFALVSCNKITDKQGNEVETNKVLESDSSDISSNYVFILPSAYNGNTKFPIIYLIDPHANGREPIEKYAELADKYGFILVASNEIRNRISDAESMESFVNLQKIIHKRFNIDKEQQYTAGFSGGAKYAIIFAYKLSYIRGVIACGGTIPFPRDYVPNFYYSGIVGTHDFNYLEVMQTSNGFAQHGFDFTLETFEGGHEWPPAENFEMGMNGLRLFSIKIKVADKDENWTNNLYDEMFDKVYSYNISTNAIARYKVLQQMDRWFYNIRSVADIKRELSKVENSSEFKNEVNERSQLVRSEVRLRSGYIKAIETRDLDWWKGEAEKLNSYGNNTEVNNVNQRLKSYISMACYSFISSDLSNNNTDGAFKKLQIYKLIEKDSYYVYLISAKYHLQVNDREQMVTDFNKAVKYGFKDFRVYEKDDIWKELLNQKEIVSIIK